MKQFPFLTSSYQMVNIVVGLILVTGFFWLLILAGGNTDYPIECVHVKYTGQECVTCGLTRSFSAMIRGDLSSAGDYNRNGPLLFTFFVSQFFMRVLAGYLVFRIRPLAVADATISIILFLVCFRYLLIPAFGV